ncbi:hypothetical protein G4228_019312 [Cervus hanglu yarkandensis]|nr:hypothetical protein G4228_019312 [Cervus hanglu yarkandensis]
MEAEKSSLVVRDLETPKKDIQMRVTPSEVKFLDALAGRVYRLPVTVHNLGRSNQKIRFQEPVKPQFKLILTSLDKALASGLQTTAVVEYHPDKNEDMCDQLLISVGNKTIEIPLIGLIPSCQLEIEPEVNFGTLVACSKVYCKEISIINHGSVPGIFKTEYQGQLPIVIFPTSGVVKPKSSMVIKVDFCADQPIVVNELAKVSLQDRPDIFLNIRARVVEQIIELLNINNDRKLECISFGSVFFGTSKIERALLYNNSPEPINWVAIMQDDSVGEELGTNIKQRTDVALNNLAYLRKIKSIDITTIISCVPNEGRLLPYQKILITFCFSPKLIVDGQKNDPTHRQDYAVFLRFESVGTKDGFLRDDNQIIKSDSFQKVELALTGSGLPVLLQFDPGRVLTFAPCFMGGHSEIHCVMQNRSKSLPLMYHFKKTAHFKIDPQKGKIDEGCMQNVTCSFIPHQVGVFKVKQFIEIIGSVADENLQSSSLKPFHQIYLYFNSVCKPSTKKVVMKVNPGLSPLVSNPTGQFVVKDLVQYKNHAPVAMLQSAMTHIHNHKIKKELIKGALIAFPNDRAASIRSGEDHKNFRTIFTKIPRYNYVDPDFAYTKFEKIEKKSHEKYYAEYIKYLRNVRLQKEAHRSFTFTVNNMPGGHILVMAVVLPVRLELSSNELILRPQGFLVKSCFRGTVRMYNHQNYFVKFKWQPINTGKGMAFSIRPAKGTVEPYSSLECEVTWQPGFDSPERGEFILHVSEGNTLTLKCLAHICDQSLLSMINIIPSQGIIPLGGLTVLNISCTPTVKEKFDTRAKVAIRRANDIDLRIGGSVEVADVEIHPNRFNFSGTYIGATHIMPFLVKNKGVTRARVEFNLEDADGFSLDFEGKSGKFTDPAFPNIFFLDLEEETSVECGIAFSPKEVATYNFTMQVRVNFFAASELDSQCCFSDSNVIPNTPPDIQLCYIQATVLQAPLTLSSTYFIFEIPLHNLDPNGRVTETQNLVLHNTSRKNVEWNLDIRNTDKLFKDVIFKFSTLSGTLRPNEECNVAVNFCPKQPGEYTADIPMRLNDNPVCYRMLHLLGEIKSPKLLFVPPFIFFTPVPLDVPAVMDVNILPQNYFRNSALSVRISPAKLLDGNEIQPLSVSFPKGRVIVGSSLGINASLTCRLSFKSSKSVSLFTHVLFYDSGNNWFPLPVTATAENCMLTIYSYMAIHLDEQKIIVKYEKDASSVKVESKSLLASRETGLPSTAPGKCSGAEPAKRKLFIGMEIIPERLKSSKYEMPKKGNRFMKKEAKDKEFFSPKEGTRTYDFFLKTINAVQTWFSLFGWPEGPHSLRIPETVRRDVYKIQVYSSALSAKKFSRQSDFSKYNKTIYDVLVHLCGKMPPGINSSQSLPVDYPERVIQLHCQHSLLLEFLSAQGACISHVLPEFLLEPEDYKKWIEIASSTSASAKLSHIPKGKHPVVIDMIHFEAWSKRSWTDVFLQIYKVLILSRVVPYSINNLPPIHVPNSPKVNAYFASSNIYSTPERILLSWMNTVYENSRHVIWKNCQKGVIPPEKWIVNFDEDLLDGLVFATVLGAYCPFLIESHFINMYTQPKSSEQYLHNCLIVVNVLREIGFDMDIQAADICDPNPILMLMFCVYMYERLPTYLPKKVVPFHCTLHDTVFREIQLKNPSLKSLVYTATIVGRDASDFSLSQAGNTVTISAKNQITITLKFTSRFLHPAEASLLLISRLKNGIGGTTMTFALKGEVLNFKAIATIKCKSPCYTWQEITVKVKNPFQASGDFNVILVESSTFISLPSQLTEAEESLKQLLYLNSTCKICKQALFHVLAAIKSNFIKEFFCSTHTLHLAAKGTSSLELIFLPFGMHTRYCVIILSNREIGELIYILEGRGIIPLPSRFIPMDSSTPLEYSNSPEEVLTKDDPVLYLKCKLHQILDVDLKLPLTNEAKEKALAFAAQQQMSKIEYERRLLTGTLESSSIRVAIALLGLTKIEMCMLLNVSKLKKPKSIVYKAELSLPEHFDIPKTVCIPQIPETQVELAQYQGNKPAGKTAAARSVPVPLRFVPLSPGRYPCKILLTSRYDVRLYCIEGVVNEERPEARFDFETPAFEALTQNIPINNETKNEWKCQVTIEGEWFHGPPILYVGPGETVDYPLTFKPILECEIMGRLILQNEADGMEHIFDIKGIGKRPLALEYITVDCQVGEVTNKHIIVPNYTPSILTFKVSSDLPIVWGNPDITIDPDNTVPYILHVCPWKRGIFKGTISFSVKSKHDGDSQEDSDEDQDRDQIPFFKKSLSELSDKFDEEKPDNAINNLRIWYYLEIHSAPGPPLKIIDMKCVAMESVCIEVPLINPKEKIVHFDVLFSSAAFSGLDELELFPRGSVNYIVRYSPACTGFTEESIVFQPDSGLEFWYLLKITTDLPEPTIMKEIYCDLGKVATEMICLDNPTCETLELHATNSNTENFVLEIKRLPLIIPPNSTRDIPIHFRPSALGRASHQTSVIFHCAQFKEWIFLLSGIGLFPQPHEIQKVTASLHLQASVPIPFQNPTKDEVFIDIILTGEEKPKRLVMAQIWDSFLEETSAFKISGVTHTKGIALPPKGTLDIQVLFMPQVMKLQKTMVLIQMRKASGKRWLIDNFMELHPEVKRGLGLDSEEILEIRWIYPIVGLPQAPPPENSQIVIKCQARKRLEEEVEVTLDGDFWGKNPILDLSDFIVIPKRKSYAYYEDIEDVPMKREFEYDIEFESEVEEDSLESCVAIYLIKKSYNAKNEQITLVFNLIFTPKKPARSQATLKVECMTDGIWTFPMMLIATEPDVDEVIDIEGVGLFKESTVNVRLTSQARNPESFTANFLPGSDPEFFVKPQIGELLPKGTLITVGFIPTMYSRKYKATLSIQTADMYWLYEINGLPQVSVLPVNVKAKVDARNKVFNKKPAHRRNFLYENAQLTRTGVSSTIKGAPLVLKNK